MRAGVLKLFQRMVKPSLVIVFMVLSLFLSIEIWWFHRNWIGGQDPTRVPIALEAFKAFAQYNGWQTGLVVGMFAAFGFLIRLEPRTTCFCLEAFTLSFLGFAMLCGVVIHYEIEYMLTSNALRADYEYLLHIRIAQKGLFAVGVILFGITLIRQRAIASASAGVTKGPPFTEESKKQADTPEVETDKVEDANGHENAR